MPDIFDQVPVRRPANPRAAAASEVFRTQRADIEAGLSASRRTMAPGDLPPLRERRDVARAAGQRLRLGSPSGEDTIGPDGPTTNELAVARLARDNPLVGVPVRVGRDIAGGLAQAALRAESHIPVVGGPAGQAADDLALRRERSRQAQAEVAGEAPVNEAATGLATGAAEYALLGRVAPSLLEPMASTLRGPVLRIVGRALAEGSQQALAETALGAAEGNTADEIGARQRMGFAFGAGFGGALGTGGVVWDAVARKIANRVEVPGMLRSGAPSEPTMTTEGRYKAKARELYDSVAEQRAAEAEARTVAQRDAAARQANVDERVTARGGPAVAEPPVDPVRAERLRALGDQLDQVHATKAEQAAEGAAAARWDAQEGLRRLEGNYTPAERAAGAAQHEAEAGLGRLDRPHPRDVAEREVARQRAAVAGLDPAVQRRYGKMDTGQLRNRWTAVRDRYEEAQRFAEAPAAATRSRSAAASVRFQQRAKLRAHDDQRILNEIETVARAKGVDPEGWRAQRTAAQDAARSRHGESLFEDPNAVTHLDPERFAAPEARVTETPAVAQAGEPAAGGAGAEYAGRHRPPTPENGAPFSDLTAALPDDVYGPNAVQYYGTGNAQLDRATFAAAKAVRGNPDAPVTVYRAVPSGATGDIQPGDWITPNHEYAKMHGEATLGGDYRIVSKSVRAGDVFTNGDSVHEAGYWPAESRATVGERGAVPGAVVSALGRGAVGAAAGGYVGAHADPEHPVRGAVLGAAAGAAALGGGPIAARALVERSSLVRRAFLSRGNLPEEIFGRKLQRDYQVADVELSIREGSRDLRRAASDVFGRRGPSEADWAKMDAVLKGDAVPSTIPAPLRQPIARMRNDIDAMSRRMIASGAVSPEAAAKVTNNLGRYVTRSYRIFDDPAWAKRIPEAVRNRVRNLLIAEMPNASQAEITGALGELLDKGAEGPMTILREGKLGAKDLTILKKREDIAPEIRALWGEYHDPRANYARSMQKMGNLVANHAFLTDVRQEGMGTHFFDRPTGDAVRQIAAEGSQALAPLNGLYVTPELADAFTRQFASQGMGIAGRLYMLGNGAVSLSKTVLSPVTQIRNVLGNVLFAVANGHANAAKFVEGVRGTLAGLGIKDDTQWRSYYHRLVSLGVVGESPNAGELRAIINDIAGRQSLARSNPVAKGVEGIFVGAQRLYGAGDDFWKVYAFENELARYRKALPNVPTAELEQRVAAIVRDTYPTYSLVPEGVQALRRFPLAGQFVSFPAEVVRTLSKTLALTHAELADPALRAIGAQRLAGLAAAAAVVPAAAATSRLLTGTSQDDENDLRRFLPDWQRNSTLVHVARSPVGGQYAFLDAGYSDPYAVLRRPVTALMRGEPMQAAQAIQQTFFGEKLLAGALLDVARNTDENGRQVVNPEASAPTRMAGYAGHLWDAAEPGAITTGRRIARGVRGDVSPGGRAYKAGEEITAAATGQRVTRVDIPQAVAQKAREYARRRTDARAILSRVAGSRGTVSDSEIRASYEEATTAEQGLFGSLAEDVQAARRLGVSDWQIRRLLDANGLSKHDAGQVLAGNFEPFQPTSRWLQSRVEQARALGDQQGQEAEATVRERRQAVRDVFDDVPVRRVATAAHP